MYIYPSLKFIMAYRRKTYRRRHFRKQPWYRRKYNAMEIATKAWRATRYLKGLVNSEMFNLITQNSVSINWSGSTQSIVAVPQGDDPNSRTGNSIFVRSILVRFVVSDNSSNLLPTNVKLILFQDNQQISDSTPGMGDILQTTASALAPLSPLQQGTLGRFKILKTWHFTIDPSLNRQKTIDYYRKMYHHVRFNGAAGSDVQKGALYIGYITDRNTNLPTLEYMVKVSYHDN